jgi:hypothetical protein
MVASTVTRQRVEGRPMTEELRLAGVPVRDEVTGRRGLAAQSASHHSSEMRGTQHLAAQALGLPMDHRVPINAVPTEGHDSRPGFRRSLRRGQVRRKPAAFAAGSRSRGAWGCVDSAPLLPGPLKDKPLDILCATSSPRCSSLKRRRGVRLWPTGKGNIVETPARPNESEPSPAKVLHSRKVQDSSGIAAGGSH